MAIDPVPGVLNPIRREGRRRQVGNDDVDASGARLWAHKKSIMDANLRTNVLKGITRYQAQVLTRGAELPKGETGLAGKILDVFKDKMISYRIRIPVIHQVLPHPCTPGLTDEQRALLIQLHPQCVFEQAAMSFRDAINPGATVWVSFQVGGSANRLVNGVIESLISNFEGSWDCESGFISAANAHQNAINQGNQYTGPNLSTSAVRGAANAADWENLSDACRAKRYYAKLLEAGLNEEQAIGLMANMRAESSHYSPTSQSGVDTLGAALGHSAGADSLCNVLYAGNNSAPCSFGLFQNFIGRGSDTGGISMLRYTQEQAIANRNRDPIFDDPSLQDVTDQAAWWAALKTWAAASEENKDLIHQTIINEDDQLAYAVAFSRAGGYDEIATQTELVDGVQMAYYDSIGPSGNTSDGVRYYGAEAYTVWWLQKYEKASGYKTPEKAQMRIAHLYYVRQEIDSVTNEDCGFSAGGPGPPPGTAGVTIAH